MTDREELAFPSADGTFGGWNQGMTLRDWFAGQALSGILADPDVNGSCEMTAKVAFNYADAMLAAREQKAQPTPPQMQHVAYYDEGAFHWMSGIAPRDCELYTATKGGEA